MLLLLRLSHEAERRNGGTAEPEVDRSTRSTRSTRTRVALELERLHELRAARLSAELREASEHLGLDPETQAVESAPFSMLIACFSLFRV